MLSLHLADPIMVLPTTNDPLRTPRRISEHHWFASNAINQIILHE